MNSNDFKIGQWIRFRNAGESSWSASYIVRAITSNGLILGVSKDTKHMFSLTFENQEFKTEEVSA